MYRAWDRLADIIVPASAAVEEPRYYCPRCLWPAHLRRGRYRADHFAHNQGGDPDCEDYHPGSSDGGGETETSRRLGLRLSLNGSGEWSLYVELPEIPIDHCRTSSPRSVQSSHVKISGGSIDHDRSVPGIDLWPGAGRNAVPVQPTHEDTKSVSGGKWPDAIHRRRWAKTLPGLDPNGVVFVRSRGGAFHRYDEETPVCWGNEVILIRKAAAAPPAHLNGVPLKPVSAFGEVWHGWRITLPKTYQERIRNWFWSLGVTVGSSWEGTRLVTPPYGYFSDGSAKYLVGSPVAVHPVPTAEVIASELRGHFSAYASGDGYSSLPICEVTADVAGTVSVRNDRAANVLRFELVAQEPHHYDTSAPAWFVDCDGEKVLPFKTRRCSSRNVSIQIRASIPSLTFTIRTATDSASSLTQLSGNADTANSWLSEHFGRARLIEVDCGNLGFIRLEIDSPVAEQSELADEDGMDGHQGVWHWSTAFAISADQTGDTSTPHWRTSTSRQHLTTHRRGR